MNTAMTLPTHYASLGNETVEFHESDYEIVVSELVARNPGKGAPLVTRILAASPAVAVDAAPAVVSDQSDISESGRARAMFDAMLARENGFVPQSPIYSIGTRVNETGVENARRSQLEHDAKPLAIDVSTQLRDTIRAEKREDLQPYRLAEMKLSMKGALFAGGVQNAEGRWVGGHYLGLETDAFKRLVGRAIDANGAAGYLADCPPELRAKNFNFWSGADTSDRTHVLRTRLDQSGNRRVFAAVSERYTAFDGDKIAEALALAFPSDARGSVDYDGSRYRVEGLWHSDVAPEEYVAGEIFKAGVIVRGADDGSGSIRIQSVIWRNLCLNLIILDRAIGVDVRIRHTGTVAQLASEFRKAFGKALQSVDAFRGAWGRAMQERDEVLVARSAGTTSHDIEGLPASAVLAGLFNGIVERELVKIPGRRVDIVPKLIEMHNQDEARAAYGVSRASIVNAFTRYAHRVESNTFAADIIREGAGSLLSAGRGLAPAPLPFEAFESF